MSQYYLEFDNSSCIACYGCSVACKASRELPLGIDWMHVTKKWRGKGTATRPVYFGTYCQQCVNAPCVNACPTKALSQGDNGVVVIEEAKCISCQTCLSACPYGVPQFADGSKMLKCDMCLGKVDLENDAPPCVLTCPPKALKLTKISTDDKKKHADELKALLDAPYYED